MVAYQLVSHTHIVPVQMVSVDESGPKASVSTEPEGLSNILKQSVILDALQVREVSIHTLQIQISFWWPSVF